MELHDPPEENVALRSAPLGPKREMVPVWVLVAAVTALTLLFGGVLAWVYLRTTDPARAGIADALREEREHSAALSRERDAVTDALAGLMRADLVSAAEESGIPADGTYFAVVYDVLGKPSAPVIELDWGQVFIGRPATRLAGQLDRKLDRPLYFESRDPKLTRLPLLPRATVVLFDRDGASRVAGVDDLFRTAKSPRDRATVFSQGFWVRVSRGEVSALTQQYTPR